MRPRQKDIQNIDRNVNYKDQLIAAMLPFVKDLLEKYGEFFPLSAVILADDTIGTVATYDGDEKPLSDTVIIDLKKALNDGGKNGKYKAAAIFYDVLVTDPSTNLKTDAVAVIYEYINDNSGLRLFYPYTITNDKQLSFTTGWSDDIEKEIFVK